MILHDSRVKYCAFNQVGPPYDVPFGTTKAVKADKFHMHINCTHHTHGLGTLSALVAADAVNVV